MGLQRRNPAGNPFYERLNRVLDETGFDAFVEGQCAKFYADGVGRPSLAPFTAHCHGLLAGHRTHSLELKREAAQEFLLVSTVPQKFPLPRSSETPHPWLTA